MRFVLATHNPGKLREMGEILRDLGVEVVSPAALGIPVDVEETGTTFLENALLKAKAICRAANLPAIAARAWTTAAAACFFSIPCGAPLPGPLTSPVPLPVSSPTGTP